jgi:hypothetical protein
MLVRYLLLFIPYGQGIKESICQVRRAQICFILCKIKPFGHAHTLIFIFTFGHACYI